MEDKHPKTAVSPDKKTLRKNAFLDASGIVLVAVLLLFLSWQFDFVDGILDRFNESRNHSLDAFMAPVIFVLIAGIWFVLRRRNELLAELEWREALETEVRTLSGLLPICAWCKRIRDDQGSWNNLETYLAAHSNAAFTHGICPDCMRRVDKFKPPHSTDES
jgi:hypothetical protein